MPLGARGRRYDVRAVLSDTAVGGEGKRDIERRVFEGDGEGEIGDYDHGARIRRKNSTTEKLSCPGARDGRGMRRQDGNLPERGLGFVENSQLPQDRAAVVVDFPPSQTVGWVESVYTA